MSLYNLMILIFLIDVILVFVIITILYYDFCMRV